MNFTVQPFVEAGGRPSVGVHAESGENSEEGGCRGRSPARPRRGHVRSSGAWGDRRQCDEWQEHVGGHRAAHRLGGSSPGRGRASWRRQGLGGSGQTPGGRQLVRVQPSAVGRRTPILGTPRTGPETPGDVDEAEGEEKRRRPPDCTALARGEDEDHRQRQSGRANDEHARLRARFQYPHDQYAHDLEHDMQARPGRVGPRQSGTALAAPPRRIGCGSA
jgi:hypothetical protein